MNEPANSPAWKPRIERLAAVMRRPMHVAEVCVMARKVLDWTDAKTVNVLAAGEKTVFRSTGTAWAVIGTPRTARAPAFELPKRSCLTCDGSFVPRRTKQVYCSNTCRQAAYMRRAV